MGSWREGSGSPVKSKARGSKALGQRSVHGFVDRWVEGSRSKIGSWVRRSVGRRLWVEDRRQDRLRGGDDGAPICV